VNRGRFREDLLFRMCQVRVQLPPLRERAEDLPLLVRQILVDLGHPERVVDEKDLRALQVRSWPGNVRELRNVLVVWGSAAVTSLEEAFQSGPQMRHAQVPLEPVTPTRTWAEEKAYPKGRYFMALWGACRGNITRIAKVAGVQRKVAREALRAIGMDAQDDASGERGRERERKSETDSPYPSA
jgi:two-component system, NtrC family, response regulator HydG